MNKKFLLSLGLALLCIQSMVAQTKVAPNYFKADPTIYKYRMQSWSDWDGTGNYVYNYNDRGCLTAELTYQNEEEVRRTEYTYNDKDYLVLAVSTAISESGEEVVDHKDVYTRDDNGFVKTYVRWTLHAAEDEEPTLKEDVKINYIYDKDMRLVKCEMYQFVEEEQKLESEVGRTCEIKYDAQGRQQEVIQLMPSGNEIWREVFAYDEQGRMYELKFIPGEEYTTNQTITWLYEYDDNGDIYQSGRAGFMFEYEYDLTKLSSETFMPLFGTEADWVYLGPRNLTLFKNEPIFKDFKHVPVSEKVNSAEAVYEPVTTTGIAAVAASNAATELKVAGNSLQVHSADAKTVGQTLRIYSLGGELMLAHRLISTNENIDIQSLPIGEYIATMGKTSTKFIKR